MEGNIAELIVEIGRPIDHDHPAPDSPYPGSPADHHVTYCTLSNEIMIKDQNGDVTCVLSEICTGYQPYYYSREPDRFFIASQARIIARWSNWVKDNDDPWIVGQVMFSTIFYKQGHFADKAYATEIPGGRTYRECGIDVPWQPCVWPDKLTDVSPIHRFITNPLPTFDDMAHLKITHYHPSGHCGLPPYTGP